LDEAAAHREPYSSDYSHSDRFHTKGSEVAVTV